MRCYVIATLGTSPAVLTELCYALIAGEGADVVGLEVWTTGGDGQTGQATIEKFVQEGRWDALVAALGDRGDRVPRPRLGGQGNLDDVAERIEAGERPWRLEVFRGEDGPLPDIRDAADAQLMDETLFNRVRWLQRNLPGGVSLVGSLAGGRKTMSAGLQSAFSLLGSPDDRLVHVLLHPAVEALGPAALRDYVAPTAEWAKRTGVPPADQITLHDVHFPMLRPLLRQACLEKTDATVERILAEQDYGDLVRGLRTVATTPPEAVRGELRRDEREKKWWLTITAGGAMLHRCALDWVKGQCYLAIAAHPGGATPETLFDWLLDQGAELNDSKTDKEVRSYWSQQRKRLGAALSDLRTLGLVDFLVRTETIDGARHDRIPAAADGRLRFDPADIVG